MNIYINSNYEIVHIYNNDSNTAGLTEILVDREQVFGKMSDFMILNYKYVPLAGGGFSISPNKNYEYLEMLDNFQFEIQSGMEALKKQNAELSYLIMQQGGAL